MRSVQQWLWPTFTSISKDFHSIKIMSWSQAFEKIDIILTENSFFQDNSHWETKLHNCQSPPVLLIHSFNNQSWVVPTHRDIHQNILPPRFYLLGSSYSQERWGWGMFVHPSHTLVPDLRWSPLDKRIGPYHPPRDTDGKDEYKDQVHCKGLWKKVAKRCQVNNDARDQ